MEQVIVINNLTKRFRGKTAVDNLTLTVPRGSIFALLGDNGAGKTTTIRMLTGLLRPDEGTASIVGLDCWSSATTLRKMVGYVPERPRFYDWMTIEEIGWFCAGFHEADYFSRYRDLIERFELDRHARIGEISKGQFAKVALSLALAIDPEVLILDEPTSGLDLLVRREFLSSMVGLAGEGRTILISSHQIVEVERVASHVAFMSRGRLLLTATMESLRQRIVQYQLQFDGQPPDVSRIGRVLQRNGSGNLCQAVIQDPDPAAVAELADSPHISHFQEVPLNLEDVYCALLQRKEGG